MRDVRLFIFDKSYATGKVKEDYLKDGTVSDPKEWWTFDIKIVDGDFVFVPEETNNMDQRAAISAFVVVGSVYGDKTYGIDWSPYFAKDTGLVNVDNQIKKNIQQNAMPDFSEGVAAMYGIQYIPNDKGSMGIRIVKGDSNVRT